MHHPAWNLDPVASVGGVQPLDRNLAAAESCLNIKLPRRVTAADAQEAFGCGHLADDRHFRGTLGALKGRHGGWFALAADAAAAMETVMVAVARTFQGPTETRARPHALPIT